MSATVTPRAAGFRMPAEWERQEAVWLAWPHNSETWPAAAIGEVRRSYGEIIRALSPDQRVRLLVADPPMELQARTLLDARGVASSGVEYFHIPTCDTWIRDYGPTFLVNDDQRRLAMVVWEFNAWGRKYEDLVGDNEVPGRLNAILGLESFEPGVVLEGGSIEVNGRGLLMTTEQCLLNPNRNPDLDRADLEALLREYLGAAQVLWLGEGIVGDDTDGHIDDVARFVDARTVVCSVEADPQDENFRPLGDNHERLKRFRDRSGNPLAVVPLPMPAPVSNDDGRLPASYANFYIGNRTVLVPLFDDPNDAVALETLSRCFPTRRVAGIPCRAMVAGLGTLHCSSQQEPSTD